MSRRGLRADLSSAQVRLPRASSTCSCSGSPAARSRTCARTVSPAPDATGFHDRPGARATAPPREDAWLVVERGGGLDSGERFDLFGGLSIGRSGRRRRPHRRPLRLRAARQDLLARRPLLRRGHELDQRDLAERRRAERGGGAGRRGRDPDRRHRVPLRAGVRRDAEGRRSRLPLPTRAASGTPTRTPTSRARRCSWSPTGWAAPRPGRSPRRPPPRLSTATSPMAPPEAILRETIEAGQPRDPRARPRRSLAAPAWGRRSPRRCVNAEAEEVAIGHVGDSRAYRLREGELELLTKDHSLVEEMRRKGQITDAAGGGAPAALDHHPRARPRARGRGRPADRPRPPGDVFLLCSDGLTTMLGDERIERLLIDCATTLDAAVRALVDEANRAGGRDNITAVAFRLEDAAAAGRRGAPSSPTLVGPSAREEGFTADEVRRRAAAARTRERRRGAEAQGAAACGERPRRSRRSPSSRRSSSAPAYGIRQVWFLGTDDAGRVALYRGPPLRPAVRDQPLRGALLEPDPDLVALRQAAGRGHRPRPASRSDATVADRGHRTQGRPQSRRHRGSSAGSSRGARPAAATTRAPAAPPGGSGAGAGK